MINEVKIGAIIPAAGSGVRMGGDRSKQFLELEGKPILLYALERFQAAQCIDAIVVASAKDQIGRIEALVQKHSLTKIVAVVEGGPQRQDSVWNGLCALESHNVDLVLVHDAVRPFVLEADIEKVAAAAKATGAAVLAVRPTDTIKQVDSAGIIRGTPERSLLWLAQTPQGFSHKIISEAFARSRADRFYATDEACLVERLGQDVTIIEGSYSNIKITTPEDLDLARFFIGRRGFTS